MSSSLRMLIPVGLALGLIACTGESTEQESDPHASTMTVEVGCASCTYEMEGVEDCELAARIDGKAYLVELEGFDAHGSGLCAGTKTAVVTGAIEGDRFHATSLELAEDEGGHGHEAEHTDDHGDH